MDRFENRKLIIISLIAVSALFLTYKLMEIQLLDEYFRTRAEAITIDKKTLYPSRGLIYDRNGVLLTYNDPSYDIMMIYDQVDPEMDTVLFTDLLGITIESFKNRIDKDWSDPKFSKKVPVAFLKKVSPYQYAGFQEHLYKFPGFYGLLRQVRGYNMPIAGHILGYISEVDQNIVESDPHYVPGDYIGVNGIEEEYEYLLKGKKGVTYILRDNLGREVSRYKDGELDSLPLSGYDISLTIDAGLQEYGEKLMSNKKGAIVALDPATGEILSMVSSPAYDPRLLSLQMERTHAFRSLLNDTLKPLFNRPLMAQYPPGSVMKPVTALIGLDQEVTGADRYIPCNGGYMIGRHFYGCHAHPPATDISKAIAYSCNTYFFTLFREIVDKYGYRNPEQGLDELVNELNAMGLGKRLQVDHPTEKEGLVPQSAFYNELYAGSKWRSSYIVSLGIGQGELELTTLQMANLAAVIANRGHYYIPHFLKDVKGASFLIPEEFLIPVESNVEKKYFDPVIEGMQLALTGGTARLAYLNDIEVCGKTGTSENPHGEDHSVFFAFAPKENPQIAIAVYVENAGFGGSYAAPIASLMIEKYLTDSIRNSRLWLEERMLDLNLIEKMYP